MIKIATDFMGPPNGSEEKKGGFCMDSITRKEKRNP
jgi:hypothetical protein